MGSRHKTKDNYQVERYLCSLRMQDREQMQALQQLLWQVRVSQQQVILMVWTSKGQKEVVVHQSEHSPSEQALDSP